VAKSGPFPISGFVEFLPEQQLILQEFIRRIRAAYELHGFSPIETPAVERVEVLTSKGGEAAEREIYAISRLLGQQDGAETSDANLALHFDLTVPLARYVASYASQLSFPFRRYQIQKVWRGERAQAGRFREFYQCDIDIIGREQLSLLADAEMPAVIYDVFRSLAIGEFIIRISNRKILRGFLRHYGVDRDASAAGLRVIDKLDRHPPADWNKVLIAQTTLSPEVVERVTGFFFGAGGATAETLQWLNDHDANADKDFALGVEELGVVVKAVGELGVPETHFKIDLRLARGLDYYTGTVFETLLVGHEAIGSICSGGRYDDLTGFFADEKLPGVGISIGLTRLMAQLLDKNIVKPRVSTPAKVLVTSLDKKHLPDYLKIANALRSANIATEVFTEEARLGKQLKYALRKGIPLVIIAGDQELSQGQVQLKYLTEDFAQKDVEEIPLPEIAARVTEKLRELGLCGIAW